MLQGTPTWLLLHCILNVNMLFFHCTAVHLDMTKHCTLLALFCTVCLQGAPQTCQVFTTQARVHSQVRPYQTFYEENGTVADIF